MTDMDKSGVIRTDTPEWSSVKVAKAFLDKDWHELSEREQILCLEMARLQRLESRTQEFIKELRRG